MERTFPGRGSNNFRIMGEQFQKNFILKFIWIISTRVHQSKPIRKLARKVFFSFLNILAEKMNYTQLLPLPSTPIAPRQIHAFHWNLVFSRAKLCHLTVQSQKYSSVKITVTFNVYWCVVRGVQNCKNYGINSQSKNTIVTNSILG